MFPVTGLITHYQVIMDDLAYDDDDAGAAKKRRLKRNLGLGLLRLKDHGSHRSRRKQRQSSRRRSLRRLRRRKRRGARPSSPNLGLRLRRLRKKEGSKILVLAEALLERILEDSKKERSDSAAVRRRQNGQPIRDLPFIVAITFKNAGFEWL